MSLRLEVVDDPARECAQLLVSAAAAGAQIALTGGSTPRTAYELAARSASAFAGAGLWFGDERCVPPDDDRSNYKLAKESLLDPLAAAGVSPDVWRMVGELGPSAGADAYEEAIRTAGAERFDLILLGLGPDGHTLSLFPNQRTVEERSRLVVGVPEAGHEPFVPRVSMTLSVVAAAARVVFLVAGAGKADAVAAAFGPDVTPSVAVPASLVPRIADDVLVLLDSDAAARL